MTEREHLGPPPVEPLSDIAWARVERGLWARLDSAEPRIAPVTRSRRWLWLAAPAVAAAAVVAIVVGVRSGDPPLGEADPARLVSGASPSSLTFGDAHVTLDAESAVVMSRDVAAPSAVLERGGAWFAIAPRAGKPAFVVVAGDTVVRVIGTRFRVARSAEHAVVEVERGLVDVQFRGTKVEVGPGQHWSSEHPGEIETTRTAQVDPVQPVPGASEPANEPAHEPAIDRPDRRPAKAIPGTTRPRSVKHDPVKLPDAAKPVSDFRTRFDQLQSLEVRDPKTAITGYLELARGTDRWAAMALYAAGRLAADRGEARARALLEKYLQRFPAGANADDAREQLGHLGGAR
jgi:hypothetical protein